MANGHYCSNKPRDPCDHQPLFDEDNPLLAFFPPVEYALLISGLGATVLFTSLGL